MTVRKETWVYLGLLCWISIGFTTGQSDPWDVYLRSFIALACVWSPALVTTWLREGNGTPRFSDRNRRIWLICYLGYLPFLLFLSGVLMNPVQLLWSKVFACGVCIALLESILLVNSLYLNNLQRVKWVRKLSVEKAVLISITGLALLLGAMAVSSLDNPIYDSGKQLLIGFEIHLLKIAARFPTFVSYSLQLFIMYLAGYFFFYYNS